jgi:diguanylate cyclase (GGDEF)-like protein/PAS domain S-box-containing protein
MSLKSKWEFGSHTIILNLVTFGTYYLLAILVADFFRAYGQFPAPNWPSASIALTAALMGGRRLWPGIFLGSFFANYHLFDATVLVAALVSLTNTLGPAVVAAIILRLTGTTTPFYRFRDVVIFILFGSGLHGVVVATGGIAAGYAGGMLEASLLPSAWLRWCLADAGGTLFFAPTLLLWLHERKSHLQRQQWWVLTLVSVATIALATLFFFLIREKQHAVSGLPYLLVAPLLWVTVRHSVRAGATLFSVVAVVACIGTVSSYGPFILMGAERPVVTLGLMVVSLSISVLAIGSLTAERSEALRRLEEANEELEHRVMERTAELIASGDMLDQQLTLQQRLIDAIPTPVYYTDEKGQYAGCNRAFEGMLNIDSSAIVGSDVQFDHFPADSFSTQKGRRETTLIDSAGRTLHVLHHRAPFFDSDGKERGVVGTVLDITDRKQLEEKLFQRATRDGMTGLANRTHFFENGEREIKRAVRSGQPLCALMIDIDKFKSINDRFGHACGDQAIVAVANVCQEIMRTIDVIGRIGGEEYAALLAENSLDSARAVAERLRAAVNALRLVAGTGEEIALTISVGITTLQEDDKTLDDLLSRADRALYEAKKRGRNCVCTA